MSPSSTSKGVLLAGEPMGLLMAQSEGPLDQVSGYDLAIAGAEFNVAVGLSRLGHPVSYATKLGRDPFGSMIVRGLAENGIDSSLVTYSDDKTTGFMLKSLVHTGDPEIYYYRKGSAASTLSVSDLEGLDWSSYRLLHMTGILPPLSDTCLETAFFLERSAARNGLTVTFDPNLRPRLWKSEAIMTDTLNKLAAMADVVLPGVSEGRILTGSDDKDDIADFYLYKNKQADDGPRTRMVAVKVGGQGAYLATREGRRLVPGFHVDKVVDTVGAGDGFATGVISGLLEGLRPEEAVRRGNAIGARQVTFRGDNNGLPTKEELAAFIRDHS